MCQEEEQIGMEVGGRGANVASVAGEGIPERQSSESNELPGELLREERAWVTQGPGMAIKDKRHCSGPHSHLG